MIAFGSAPLLPAAAYCLQQALDDFIETGCLDCAPDTVRFYRIKSGHLLRLLGGDLPLAQLSMELLRDYIQKRLAEGAKDTTLVKELITLRRALKVARENGRFHREVREVVPRFRVRYLPLERWLTPDQFRALLEQLDHGRRLWVMLAALAGARFSEVERLTWDDVDLALGWLRIPGTKTAKSRRRVPLAKDLLEALKADGGSKGPLVSHWGNACRDLARACARAKVLRVTPNDLRRTFASWLKQAGHDSLVVAKLMGHSTTRMVELVYGHLSTKQYEVAIAGLPALSAAPPAPVANSPAESRS